ncbi:MAG TPA: hypothetical protein VEW42_05335 [Candidatus Eisenbacteria bacterium]|nr:hypothetical protein [Candidatus Eisenbacteria bacterium]
MAEEEHVDQQPEQPKKYPQKRRTTSFGSEGRKEERQKGGIRGGRAVRDQHKDDPDFFKRLGQRGGQATSERFKGTDHYEESGRTGGEKTRDTLGSEHYSKIGRVGGRRSRPPKNRGS